MLSNKAKYGLKALMHITAADGKCLANDIASANNIPRKFLDAILVELRNAGILNSRKGKGGGYHLARPAEKITVGQIIRILDGPLAPIACASRTAYQRCADCPDEDACAIRDIMLDVRDFDRPHPRSHDDLGALQPRQSGGAASALTTCRSAILAWASCPARRRRRPGSW